MSSTAEERLAQAFVAVKHYLQQQQLTTPNAILAKLTGDPIFAQQVDWKQVHFHTAHLGHSGTFFRNAVMNLSTVSAAKCHIQVVIVNGLTQLKTGWTAAKPINKPTLFIANSSNLRRTKQIKDEVKHLQKQHPTRFIRFDFLNPDEAKMAKLEDPNTFTITQESLFRVVKEAVAAMDLELSYQSTAIVTEDDFKAALDVVASSSAISNLFGSPASTSASYKKATETILFDPTPKSLFPELTEVDQTLFDASTLTFGPPVEDDFEFEFDTTDTAADKSWITRPISPATMKALEELPEDFEFAEPEAVAFTTQPMPVASSAPPAPVEVHNITVWYYQPLDMPDLEDFLHHALNQTIAEYRSRFKLKFQLKKIIAMTELKKPEEGNHIFFWFYQMPGERTDWPEIHELLRTIKETSGIPTVLVLCSVPEFVSLPGGLPWEINREELVLLKTDMVYSNYPKAINYADTINKQFAENDCIRAIGKILPTEQKTVTKPLKPRLEESKEEERKNVDTTNPVASTNKATTEERKHIITTNPVAPLALLRKPKAYIYLHMSLISSMRLYEKMKPNKDRESSPLNKLGEKLKTIAQKSHPEYHIIPFFYPTLPLKDPHVLVILETDSPGATLQAKNQVGDLLKGGDRLLLFVKEGKETDVQQAAFDPITEEFIIHEDSVEDIMTILAEQIEKFKSGD